MNKCWPFRCIIVGIITMIFTLNVSAYDFEVNGIYYNVVSAPDNTCEVATPDNLKDGHYNGNIVIPSQVTYQGYTLTVERIGKYAFSNSKNLISVEIPSSVKQIKDGAFLNCSSLITITIPQCVTHLGEAAFMGCSSLKKAIIGPKVYEIKDGTFNGCTNLSYLAIMGPGQRISFGNQESWVVKNELKRLEQSNSVKGSPSTRNKNSSNKSSSTNKKNTESTQTSNKPKYNGTFGECPLDTVYIDRYWGVHMGNPIFSPLSPKVLIIGPNVTQKLYNFNKADNLKTIIVESSTPPTAPEFPQKIYFEASLYVPSESINSYKEASGWKAFKNIKPIDVKQE